MDCYGNDYYYIEDIKNGDFEENDKSVVGRIEALLDHLAEHNRDRRALNYNKIDHRQS